MAINPIQFQKGFSLNDFIVQYGTETQCREALMAARWPSGFACPGCQQNPHYCFQRQGLPYWQCKACGQQTSLYAGTLFEHTRLPLRKWFLGMYLLTQAKTNLAALELQARHLLENRLAAQA